MHSEKNSRQDTWIEKHCNMQTFAFLKNSCFSSCLAVGLHMNKKKSMTSKQDLGLNVSGWVFFFFWGGGGGGCCA